MRYCHKVAIVLGLVLPLAGLPAALAQADLPAFGDDPRIAEAGLEIGVFASGLDFPMGLTELPDGSLLVATSHPVDGSFFQSEGALVRLTDEDGDGIADDAGTVLAEGLLGPLVVVKSIDDLVVTTTVKGGQETIYIFRKGTDWSDPLQEAGTIELMMRGSEHQSYGVALRPYVETPGGYDLFFNLGAFRNERGGNRIDIGGLTEGTVIDSSVVMVTIVDEGSTLTASEPLLIATGLRNASTLEIDPISGDLVIGENGIDTPSDRIVSLSADEIDIIPAAEIGGEPEDFGYPETYYDYQTGEIVGGDGRVAAVVFPPLDGVENEGIAAIAPVPSAFPEALQGGWFAGFHGQFDLTGIENEENPLVWADPATGEFFHVISNENPGVGHLDSLLTTDDALFAAELCATGTLAGTEPCGVIYRITAGG